MHLAKLKLTQFKNYAGGELSLSPRLNCFVGANGAGKTNLLEAVYYLCMGKSYASTPDQYAIQHGLDVSRLDGEFRTGDAGAPPPVADTHLTLSPISPV